jgi:hypothetical protein
VFEPARAVFQSKTVRSSVALCVFPPLVHQGVVILPTHVFLLFILVVKIHFTIITGQLLVSTTSLPSSVPNCCPGLLLIFMDGPVTVCLMVFFYVLKQALVNLLKPTLWTIITQFG